MKKNRYGLPVGFKPHDGEACPLDPQAYVETLIHTAEGLGSGGVTMARLHSWEAFSEEGGLGTVAAYRLAKRGEMPKVDRKLRL